ncbi:macro domain-containing protein [Massilia sp. W12]|uniref:type II toxin-antitoxin system antitoxin DNA ADP-ribosyl glycohydrolase DarG n=1 Tax=Massilia sp. W12 TaxID=3126507 RepID=UPI0030D19FF2
MITYKQGNLLEAPVEALVNTVNTVGVMGKGIALMFKERFADNFRQYAAACKAQQVQTGKMFVTRVHELDGPRWIVNFPTKQHWRAPSRMEWIIQGLQDLRGFLLEQEVQSIALPPLGAGNGGLAWEAVREQIITALGDLPLEILVYEPTAQYQNVSKRSGVEKLTPARALIAELVRCYAVLAMECSLMEIQKLAWFLERAIVNHNMQDHELHLQFVAHKYGPYAQRLHHLINHLDGSYLHSEKRIADAGPFDVIWFDDAHKHVLQSYLQSEAQNYQAALQACIQLIDGFESPFGLELLATVDWLVVQEQVAPSVPVLRDALLRWPGGKDAAERKARIFDERALGLALARLQSCLPAPPAKSGVQAEPALI